jgi:hypothetical protein
MAIAARWQRPAICITYFQGPVPSNFNLGRYWRGHRFFRDPISIELQAPTRCAVRLKVENNHIVAFPEAKTNDCNKTDA